uniref:Myb/SANT-like DNA-binding domain-containing protein n=1 Tax=Cacopsylla melanoneura TaxID=428564 RepID=A0A8D8TH44_9HEMI
MDAIWHYMDVFTKFLLCTEIHLSLTALIKNHFKLIASLILIYVIFYFSDPDDDLAPQVDPNLTPVEMWRQRTGIEDFPDVTSLLLSIIHTESMNKLFCDKKTPNKKVWELIARTMEEKGFPLAETTKVAAEKADQKYRNLKRRYKIYIDKVEGRAGNTGTCPADPPPYFDMLHPYLSGRADIHVNQSLLRSSLSYSNTPLSPFRPSPSPTPNTPLSSHSPSPSPTGNRSFFSPPSTPAGPSTDPQFTYHRPPTPSSTSSPSPTPGSSSQSRFNYVKKTIRPQTSKNAELLAYLKESDEKEREIREKEVSGLTAFMTEMLKGMKSLEQQRSETLTTLKKILNKKGRKRKQSSSDDEDD